MTRPRSCGALIQDGSILMVRHVEASRSYWTLPGGGIERGETPAEAAVREVYEETGLHVEAQRLLWEGKYGHGDASSAEYCFLVDRQSEPQEWDEARLGLDPEEAHLPFSQRLLQGVAWVPLTRLGHDPQVARVLMALMADAEEQKD